jgi:DNA-binding MarR family transcriptional regulator/GNAT superfamily N-acetyltransferase
METIPVEALRRFNRFYTRHIGALEEGLLKTPFTLTQARVLFELGTRKVCTFSEINGELRLDPGYLSRTLQGFAAKGLISRRKSTDDARRVGLSLTAKGKRAFAQLDERARKDASALLAQVTPEKRTRLLTSLGDVQRILSQRPEAPSGDVVIRTHRIGDVGWAIERHAQLYSEQYRWNEEFEALVAMLFANFAKRHDPACERFWVAELDGERVGCVFVVRNDDDPAAAQLRCLLVDAQARGLGIGRRLVDVCIAFARSAGYSRVMLWTNDALVSARRIYEAAGFELIKEEPHHSFGHDLVGQVWSLELR